MKKNNLPILFLMKKTWKYYLSIHLKGLLLANKNQDVIFQFINKKKKIENITQGIIFAQKDSLNLIFFQIHGCGFEEINNKRI